MHEPAPCPLLQHGQSIPIALSLSRSLRKLTSASEQPIFQDANGMAIKFFIQKDIPQEIQAEVCETIAVRLPLQPLPPHD